MLFGSIESGLFVQIVFWVLALSMIFSALAVVHIKNIFRAALCLIITFVCMAGMFILLRAEFLAAVQILIYIGAISVLLIFAILMTQDVENSSSYNKFRIPAIIISVLFAITSIFVVMNTHWQLLSNPENISDPVADAINILFSDTIPWIAQLLIHKFVIAFEVAGILLLAAVLGAFVVLRRDRDERELN